MIREPFRYDEDWNPYIISTTRDPRFTFYYSVTSVASVASVA